KYGVNFDLGVPLKSEEDFQLLYVELSEEKKLRFIKWIKDETEKHLLIAGQIGTGKTTFIEKGFKEASIISDIEISLDTEIPIYGTGPFFGVFLGKILAYANKLNIDLSPYNLPGDLLPSKYENKNLDTLLEILTGQAISIKSFEEKELLFKKIDKKLNALKTLLRIIIREIETKQGRKLFIFAEGVDKFKPHTSEYTFLLDFLDFLTPYKTLYEVNLVHAFGNLYEWQKGQKIILTAAALEKIEETLKRRLGIYAAARKEILPVISRLSGGILRQALRLLLEFDYAESQLKKDTPGAIEYSIQRVRNDFLDLPTAVKEPELLKTIHRDGYILSGVVADFKSMSAVDSLYMNWILIGDEADENNRWPAAINPLLLPALESFKTLPESPEVKALKEWAHAHDESAYELDPYGYDIAPSLEHGQLFELLSSSHTKFPTFKITEILDGMASYFLDNERKDKVIIGYENRGVVELANDFLIGKAGTYRPGHFKDIFITKPGKKDMAEFIVDSMKKTPADGYSIFFEQKLTEKELLSFDQKRDKFIEYKMVWWIPFDHLKRYLSYWTQLRQFFKIFRLEEDILGNLTKEEIEEDLDYARHIDFETQNKTHVLHRLKKVLKFLETRKHG
ncbi:MAG TPA: hypothetical protein VK186_20850, partial [Candidatus Deferrimicrobium sp.]|nr:hypothetical protein [Candidatus Deferrimicrobium sp.]